MRKKNGFISMSLVYTFFILFITIMLSLVATYAHNRILLNVVKDESIAILEDARYYKLTVTPVFTGTKTDCGTCATVFPRSFKVYPGSIRKFQVTPSSGYGLDPLLAVSTGLVNCYSDSAHTQKILFNTGLKETDEYGNIRDIVYQVFHFWGGSGAISDMLYLGVNKISSYNDNNTHYAINSEELTKYLNISVNATKEQQYTELAKKGMYIFEQDVYCTVSISAV